MVFSLSRGRNLDSVGPLLTITILRHVNIATILLSCTLILFCTTFYRCFLSPKWNSDQYNQPSCNHRRCGPHGSGKERPVRTSVYFLTPLPREYIGPRLVRGLYLNVRLPLAWKIEGSSRNRSVEIFQLFEICSILCRNGIDQLRNSELEIMGDIEQIARLGHEPVRRLFPSIDFVLFALQTHITFHDLQKIQLTTACFPIGDVM